MLFTTRFSKVAHHFRIGIHRGQRLQIRVSPPALDDFSTLNAKDVEAVRIHIASRCKLS
jgi:hypothetical protein